MIFKSKYVLKYSVDDRNDEFEIVAIIRQRDGKIKSHECVHVCLIEINGSRIDRPDIENYVNARFAIDDIYKEYKDKLKHKYRSLGKKFRTIKEEFK